jgi:hypothetical protein
MAYNFMMNQKNNFNTTASDLFDVDAGTAAVQAQANNVSTEASNMWEGLNQQFEDKKAELGITGVKDLAESGSEIGLAVANFAVTKLTGQGIAAWGAQGAKYVGNKVSGLFKGSGSTPVTESAPAVSPTDPTVAPTAETAPEAEETVQATVPLEAPITGADALPGVYETSFGPSTTTTQVGGQTAADFTNPAFGGGPSAEAQSASDFTNPAFGGDVREVTFNNPAFDANIAPEGAGPISSAPGADFAAGGDIGAPMRAAMAGRQAGGTADQAVGGTANGADTGMAGGVNNEADTSFSGTQTHGGGLNESGGASTDDLATPEVAEPDLGATPLPGSEPTPTDTNLAPDAIDPVVEPVADEAVAAGGEAALDTEAVVAGAAAETGVLAPLAIGVVAIGGLIEGIMSMNSASADKPAPPPPVPDVSAGSINTGGLAQSFQAGI